MYLYLSVAKYNLRFNLLSQIGLAIALFLLTPVMFGITALDARTAAVPLELSLSFLGVILLTPVYSSEQETGVLDTVRVRKTPHLLICGIRILMVMIFMVMLINGFVLMMYTMECQVSLIHVLASCANATFLGGLGILAAAVSGHTVIGYILPMLYYIMDLMGGFGRFTIFSMMRNGTMDGKWIIFMLGMCCIAASLCCWHLRMNRK